MQLTREERRRLFFSQKAASARQLERSAALPAVSSMRAGRLGARTRRFLFGFAAALLVAGSAYILEVGIETSFSLATFLPEMQ